METLSSIQGLIGRARGAVGGADEARALASTLEEVEAKVTELHASLESLAKMI
jgi:hypothetical protein